MVSREQSHGDSYRPVQAASVTGVFPSFARPHFVPENLRNGKANANTVYVQSVVNEQIVGFEPLEDNTGSAVPLSESTSAAVRPGDSAIYVYAFGPTDAVVGTRSVVARAIEQRFDEIAVKEFAACTAAQFAKLMSRLPDVNRRAFRMLSKLDAVSARQWRDSTVFLSTLREDCAHWIFCQILYAFTVATKANN
jgi:hypothetical protein